MLTKKNEGLELFAKKNNIVLFQKH